MKEGNYESIGRPLLLLICVALTTVATEGQFSPSPAPAPFTAAQCPSLSSAQNSIDILLPRDCYDGNYFMDNAICCPQYRSTWKILIGQYSSSSGLLALDQEQSVNCLPYLDSVIESKGAGNGIGPGCSINPINLTQASCPVITVSDFENTVGDMASIILRACGSINAMECCTKNCQNAISAAASKLAVKGTTAHRLGKLNRATRAKDCTNIVHNWLASKLNPSAAIGVFRTLEICQINKVCPVYFYDVASVSEECGGSVISDKASCCNAVASFFSNFQYQSLLTYTQAMNCASTLGMKLKAVNVTQNVYKLCHVTLKDFSAPVGDVVNCLLPNEPRDVSRFDPHYGFMVNCDSTYQNVVPAWPSKSTIASPCHKKITP